MLVMHLEANVNYLHVQANASYFKLAAKAQNLGLFPPWALSLVSVANSKMNIAAPHW